MQWNEKTQNLSLPWSKWLQDTQLIAPVSGTALLVVPEVLMNLATSIEFLSKAFGLAKELYPEMHSLLPVSNVEYELLLSDDIEIYEIKM